MLDLTQLLSQPDPNERLVYALRSLVVHKGPNSNAGHYVAYLHDGTHDEWYCYDDASRTTVGMGGIPNWENS